MEVERRIHNGWEEWEKIPLKTKEKFSWGVDGWVKKYQYIYTKDKNKISLVKLKVGLMTSDSWMWEIYCLEGNLFEDVRRFTTKKQASDEIKELLK